MVQQLGTYAITNYTVVINDISEVRQMITYYKPDGISILVERFYGDILPGYDSV